MYKHIITNTDCSIKVKNNKLSKSIKNAMNMTITEDCITGAIVVIAKCPIEGASKTRLAASGSLAPQHCHQIARAMLCDVIRHLSFCPYLADKTKVMKVLMYAPGNEEGYCIMSGILEDLGLMDEWNLRPMFHSATKEEMRSSNLGEILNDALQVVKGLLETEEKSENCGVVYLGMDSPELPVLEIANALWLSQHGTALLCPANDGGYGLLGIPTNIDVNKNIFAGVRWSDPLTAVSQLKVLSDCGLNVKLGQMMNDIDEYSDLLKLANKLCYDKNKSIRMNPVESPKLICVSSSKNVDVLSHYSVNVSNFDLPHFSCNCDKTWECLLEIGVVKLCDGVYRTMQK